MLDILYLPLLAGFSPLSPLSKSVGFGEGTGVRLVGWLGYSLFFDTRIESSHKKLTRNQSFLRRSEERISPRSIQNYK
jgi:hypothetical protein